MPIIPPMEYSQAGLSLTEKHEGLELTAYQDSVGRWTIGYGHTDSVIPGMHITPSQAQVLLETDVIKAVAAVNHLVSIHLTQVEFDALVDFVFNLGVRMFAESTLLRYLNQGQLSAAAAQFIRFQYAGGQKLAGLLHRRLDERDLFNGTANT